MAPGVFWPSLVVLGVASALAIGFPDSTREVLSSVQSQIVSLFGWYYVLVVAVFVAFSLWMGFMKLAESRLQRSHAHGRRH